MGNKHVTELKRLEEKVAASERQAALQRSGIALNQVSASSAAGECGPGLTKDPRTGACCMSLERVGNEYFCLENRV